MKHGIILRWNNAICLDGGCTSVMGADILAMFFEQFAGPDFQHWKARNLNDILDRLTKMQPGQMFILDWHDTTGAAEAIIRS